MEGKGFILPIGKVIKGKAPEGNSGMEFYDFLKRSSETPIPGTEPSMHIKFSLDKVFPGGGVEEHYHEPPVIDHLNYVISGRIRVKVGDMEKIVGPDTLIYCPSNVKCSLANVGKGRAKYLAICALDEGKQFGEPVYSKMPTWQV